MKMEIPESIKKVLRCVECNDLLSCGPVLLVHETSEAICGRCSPQPEDEEKDDSSEIQKRTRNLQYEATAKLLSFPCRFSDYGCPEKMDFSEEEPNKHECDCKFRALICPIVARGSCDWIGPRLKLSEHCQNVHPKCFFQNPCLLPRPDLAKPNLSNYLVSAFNILFLLHIKVCVTSGKLYHSIRMFGNSKLLDKYSYFFKIEGNGLKIEKECSILPSGIMMLQEPTANCIPINSLLEFLSGKYNESVFTITIRSSIIFNCLNCLKTIEHGTNTKFCDECLEVFGKCVQCKFNEKGCSFIDINKEKCEKHERYFCEYQTKCCYINCGVSFVPGSFIEHLGSVTSCRKTMKSNIDSVVRIYNTNSNNYYILFSSEYIGTIICSYYLYNSNFYLYLFTSLPSYKLKNFKCSVRIIDPQTKYTLFLVPKIVYNNWEDWFIHEKLNDFPSCKKGGIGIDIKINIDKT